MDALLTGEVTGVSIAPVELYDQPDRVALHADHERRIELKDLRENKVLWENPSVFFRQDYEATSA